MYYYWYYYSLIIHCLEHLFLRAPSLVAGLPGGTGLRPRGGGEAAGRRAAPALRRAVEEKPLESHKISLENGL